MPRVGGGEVVAFFRQNPYLADTRIVLLSGVLLESASTVDAIDGGEMMLTRGPSPGTEIVTVGVAELYGAELGIGQD